MTSGPGAEGGDGGGRIVAEGTPEDVAKVKASYTGRYLKELLARRPAGAASAHPAKPAAKPARSGGKKQAAE